MNIYERLTKARAQFHAQKLTKSGLNKFAGYSYFELADFLVPGMRALEAHGLCAVVSFNEALATMTVASVDGEKLELTSPMRSAELKGCHEIQRLGAVMTYQRRYLWSSLLEIIEHDSIDRGEAEDDGEAFLIAAALESIKNARTEEELRRHFKSAYELAPPAARDQLVAAKDARKLHLTKVLA